MREPEPDFEIGPLLDAAVPLGSTRVPLRVLLQSCLSERTPVTAEDQEAARLAARFLRAGTAELAAIADGGSWIQSSLHVQTAVPAALYGGIAALMQELLGSGQVWNAFFMHKPPGLRLRLQANPAAALDTRDRLAQAAAIWASEGLIVSHKFEHYEPEITLFGGPEAMREVHDLFTVDTAVWLALHSRPAPGGTILPASLLLLRHLFAGLGIVDWEDLEVWNKVRAMGRGFGPARAALPADELTAVSEAIATVWADPAASLTALDPSDRAVIEAAADRLRATAPRWRACLRPEITSLAPRAAAALYVIFLWNRANLSRERQALVAEALATRQVPG